MTTPYTEPDEHQRPNHDWCAHPATSPARFACRAAAALRDTSTPAVTARFNAALNAAIATLQQALGDALTAAADATASWSAAADQAADTAASYQSPINENDGTVTVFIGIGNSDRKLSARDYAQFVNETRDAIDSYKEQTIGEWHSVPGKPWLNVEFAFTIHPRDTPMLKDALRRIRGDYQQDATAWAECPRTEFI